MEQPQVADSSTAQDVELEQPAPDVESHETDDPEGLLQQEPEEQEVEDEIDGVKVRGKKELLEKIKNERLMQADYTRKTQEVAEQRKTIEAERQRVQQEAQFQQQFIKEVAQVTSIDERLAQFQNVNWAALNAQDPVQAQALHIEFTQLQARKGQLVAELSQKQQQQALVRQQEIARHIQEGQAVLERDIKGWGPELASKLVEYGQKIGFPREVLTNITQPPAIKALHKAYLYDQLVAKQAAKPKAEPQAPVPRINATKGNVVTDPDKLSGDAWLKWRNAQLRKK